MKRYFCDQCGGEMTYDTKPVRNTSGNELRVLLTGQNKQSIEVSLTVTIKAWHLVPQSSKGFRNFGDQQFGGTMLEPTREHADFCAACRWGLLEQLRGMQTLTQDTTFGTAPAIKWTETSDGTQNKSAGDD